MPIRTYATIMTQEILMSPKTAGKRLTELLKAEEIDPLLLAVANLYLQQKSVQEISQELDMREDRVAQILDKEDVQKYIQQSMLSQGFLNPLKSLQIVDKVIEAILLKSIENGELPTNKDLLDWLKEARAIRESVAPKKTTPTVAVQVNNNLDALSRALD